MTEYDRTLLQKLAREILTELRALRRTIEGKRTKKTEVGPVDLKKIL